MRSNLTSNVRIVNVTPAMAKKWLENNVQNRSLSEQTVRFLADEMKEDRFRLTNDALTFNTKGELINGQHRLTAVVGTGVTCQFIIFDNADDGVKECLDLGRSRSIPDMLKMIYGVDRARMITGAIRILDAFVGNRKIKLSVGHALEQIGRYDPAFKWAVAEVPGKNQFAISAIIAAIIYAHRTDPVSVEEFARRLFTGTGLSEGSPTLRFREYVHSRRGLFHTSEDKRECFVLCLVAIAKHMRGSRIKQLRWTDKVITEFGAAYANGKKKAVA